jgi:redox-sensitive bicupin YhaK (pirin superfamily)
VIRPTAKALSETLAWSHADEVPLVDLAPGVSTRSLWWDERGRHAVVVELAPDAHLSRAATEEAPLALYVISGAIEIDGRHFRPGAFVYSPARRGGQLRTRAGAVLFAVKFDSGSSALSWEACAPPIQRTH